MQRCGHLRLEQAASCCEQNVQHQQTPISIIHADLDLSARSGQNHCCVASIGGNFKRKGASSVAGTRVGPAALYGCM